ncbi:MAG: CocE/NonD family hydrolase [Rhodospirillales bacterium]|nr:CocE/NonD family hydrolase [Rhodospirillales bacterium]
MAKKPSRKTNKKTYKMMMEEDIFVTMRDGVQLALRIYRPEGDGAFPALFAASPYQYETDDLPHSTMFLWREVGPVQWYVEQHGYAYIRSDVRGSGKSEGIYNLLDETEQWDYYELIEWISAQPWCDGNVGGLGQSYYAWSQWFMGIVNPPSLKCIAPYDGAVDIYRGTMYHGGIYCDFMPMWYQSIRVNNLHRSANNPKGTDMPVDIGGEMAWHQTYDEWWKERSPYEQLGDIQVPVLSIGHWGKMGLHLRGNILGYEELDCPKKLVVTGARDVFEAHEMFDEIEYHEKELLPFYDHYLKGRKNGYEKRAPVRLYIRGDEDYREEKEWPLKRAKITPFHLSKSKSGSLTSLNDGGMETKKPAANAGLTSYQYPDPQWKFGVTAMGPQGPDPIRRVLTFTTAPLKEDTEVTGPIVLELYISSTATDADFIVKLADQKPKSAKDRKAGLQPASVNVSKGWMRASHREKDERRSTKHRPFYTHNSPQPIVPGEVYKLDIEVMPCAYVFKAGHRIRLEIVNGDSSMTDAIFTHQYLYYKVGTDTIHHNEKYPSRIHLPVIPRRAKKR